MNTYRWMNKFCHIKGKNGGLRQYNPQKPKKWGFKFFALCGRSGLIHRIELYTGRFSNAPVTSAIEKSRSVVVRLLNGIARHKNNKVFLTTGSPQLL